MNDAPRFQAGGSLRGGSFYVERPADQELPAALSAGEFCYVLAPRQIGKSSLRVRAQERLMRAGTRCVTLDLTRIGGRDATTEQWYFGLLDDTTDQLGISSAEPFWRAHPLLSPVQRFSRYLRQLLGLIEGDLVVFIDEIDTVLSQPSSSRDDFFAAIRALYNARADDPIYRRLTFCLIGVAMPDDLIQDQSRTPFNIGHGITLEDFTAAQANALLPGLRGVGEDPEALLTSILWWTDGHPCMTQRLCQELLGQPQEEAARPARERVDDLVQRVYLRRRGIGLEQHPIPAFSRPRQGDPKIARLLRLYARVLAGEAIRADPRDVLQMELRLTGMAAYRADARDNLLLRTRNRIFAAVYDRSWVVARESRRLISDAVDAWLGADRREEFLLQGAALAHAQDWSRGREDISAEEQEFLMASLESARRREEEQRRAESALRLAEHRHQEENARKARRNYIVVFFFVCGLFLAIWRLIDLSVRLYRAIEKEKQQRKLAEEATKDAKKQWQDAERARALAAQQSEQLRAAERAALRRELELERLSAEVRREQAELSFRGGQIRIALQMGLLRQGLCKAFDLAAPRAHELEALPLTAREGLTAAAAATAEVNIQAQVVASGSRLRVDFSPDGGRLLVNTPEDTWIRDGTSGAALRRLEGPIGPATFSLDGERVALAGGPDDPIAVWDTRAGGRVALLGRLGVLPRPAISGSGDQVAAFGDDGLFWVWDVASGRRRHLPHQRQVRWAWFAPSGRQIITLTSDHALHIFDTERGAELPVSLPHHARINDLRFSTDGARLITGSEDRHVRAYEVSAGRQLLDLSGHAAPVIAVAYSGKSERIASLSLDHTARIWDAGNGQLLSILRATGESAPLRAAAFRGTEVIAGGDDGLARIWDADTGRLLRVLEGHTAPIVKISVAPSRRYVHTFAESPRDPKERSLRRWDLGAPRPFSTFVGHEAAVRGAALSGDYLLTIGEDRGARRWDARTGALQQTLRHLEMPRFGSLSPDGRRALTAEQRGPAQLWDAVAGVVLRRLDGHRGPLCAAALSPDGGLAITAGQGRLRLWDVSAPGEAATRWEVAIPGQKEDQGSARCASFTRDGERILARGGSTVFVHDAATGARLFTLGGHTDSITAFTQQGRLIATASLDETVRLWSAETGRPQRVLRCGGPVTDLALSPRGDALVVRALSARQGGFVARRFDPRTGQEGAWHVQDPDAPGPETSGVRVLAISPDGARVLFGKDDGTVSLWSARSGQLLYRLQRAHDGPITSAAFSADGGAVITTSEDRTARLLPGSLQASLAIARQLCVTRR